MDQETRAEIDRLHGRINDLRDRTVNLEAQQPHINNALTRIERSVDKINANFGKGLWVVVAAFILAVVKFTIDGGWTHI